MSFKDTEATGYGISAVRSEEVTEMEKIKDFLRNAAISIAGGIIGAFIGMGIATLLGIL